MNSFRTTSPRISVQTKFLTSARSTSKPVSPCEQLLVTSTQMVNSALAQNSFDTKNNDLPKNSSFFHEFREGDEEKYSLRLPSLKKSSSQLKKIFQVSYTKEALAPQKFLLKGSEISNTSIKVEKQDEKRSRYMAMMDKMFESDAETENLALRKSNSHNFERLKKSFSGTPGNFSPESRKILSPTPKMINELLGVDKLYSARQSIKQILAEDIERVKSPDNVLISREESASVMRQDEKKERPKIGKVETMKKKAVKGDIDLQGLKCFKDLNLVCRGTLMSKPQYSIYQSVTNKKKVADYKLENVESIKILKKGFENSKSKKMLI